jgi:hypothetical protein
MFRVTIKSWLVPALLLWGGQSVFGFSLGGPIGNASPSGVGGDAWQIQAIGYGLVPPNFGQDILAPKNLGEEYRWNTRNVYYAFDASFLDYFGTNGEAQVDQAFAILNNLQNVDSYTLGLSEWPLASSRINYGAAAVDMVDLKSWVLIMMTEQLGLAEPDRYTYGLHSRGLVPGGKCPDYEYAVVQRNFDPVTQQYSSYVNGVLYTFTIVEECPFNPNPDAPMDADALRIPVDPAEQAEGLSSVAAGIENGLLNPNGLDPTTLGRYYLNFTRDDIGGFRYLWSSNTINTESVDSNSVLQSVPPQPTLIVTSNLAVLENALTNNLAGLEALFPTLQITSSPFLYYSNVLATNFVLFTNYQACVGQPVGCIPPVTTSPVVTTNFIPIYGYTFGNLLTNFTYTNNGVLVSNSPGEYILVPSNQCGFTILSNALTSVVSVTNTNSLTVTLFTNHTLVVDVFNCLSSSNSTALREGMEKMNFFRVDYDSLVGQTWPGVTNTYTLTAVISNRPVVQSFYRVITQPDILFSAADLTGGGNSLPAYSLVSRSEPNFNQANRLPDLAGPGTIAPPVNLILNKVGPYFVVAYPSFLIPTGGVGNTNVSILQWATYDGTTNAPYAYPGANTYQTLVNNIFLQITTVGSLTDGTIGVPYSVELQASGATPPPYTYSVVAGSGSLPNGLNLVQSNGNTFISGTPTAVGIFDFTLQVADSAGRSSVRNFSLEIDQ